MYNYETILALFLSLCFFALLFPYLTPERGQLLRLTSIYRPISLSAFLCYGIIILFLPITGTLPLICMPFLVLIGAGTMALEAREKAGLSTPGSPPWKLLGGLAITIILGGSLAVSQSLLAAIFFFQSTVALAFAWLAIEARALFRLRRSFYAGTIFVSAVVALVAMCLRIFAYVDQPVTWTTAFFPDPPNAFMGRVIATFAAFFASMAFNFEDLRIQAVQEQDRAAALYGGLFQSLVKAIAGRADHAKNHMTLSAACAELLAAKLQKHGWFQIPKDPDFPRQIGQAAPLADLGLIGLPQHIMMESCDPSSPDYALYRRHPLVGKDLLKGIIRQASRQQIQGNAGLELLELAVEIIEFRHENWDGSGFPAGKIAKEIPPAARITAIAADLAQFALQLPDIDAAFERVAAEADQKYDPLAVRVLLASQAEFRAILETGKRAQRS